MKNGIKAVARMVKQLAEALMGEEKFEKVCGALVVKPVGKMKLEQADRRRG